MPGALILLYFITICICIAISLGVSFSIISMSSTLKDIVKELKRIREEFQRL